MHAAFATCAERLLAAGHRLSAFNTLQSASDVEGLRRALKFEKVFLLGISYGTRLALTVMKLYPESIKAVVLDSVIPPQATRSGLDGETFGAVLDRLMVACERHKDCAVAYPNLHGRLLTVLEQLARQPVFIEIVNLEGRGPLYARVDHRMFLEVLRAEMYHTSRVSQLPALISGVSQGEHWRLKHHVENTVYGDFPRKYDVGANLSVICNDEAGVVHRQSDVDETGMYPYLSEYVAWVKEIEPCSVWPIGEPNITSRAAVVSEIPSLLLAGGFDASTPVELAEMATERLSQT